MGLGFIRELLAYQEDFFTHHNQLLHPFCLIMESTPHEDHFSYSILVDLMHNESSGHNICPINNPTSFLPFFSA